MSTVEISEAEYKNMTSVVGAMQKMLANPKSRSKVLEAQKLINPDAIIPELDATKPVFEKIDAVSAQVGELAKQMADERAANKDAQARAELNSQWEKSRQVAVRSGYTTEGIDALEKFMVEKGIVDHELAMPAFEKLNPPETMVMVSADRFDAFSTLAPSADEKDDLNLLLNGNESAFTNKRVNETLKQIRGR